MGQWTREELQEAHDHYSRGRGGGGADRQLAPWADQFTEDAEYLEHHFGQVRGA